ncbi:MAG: Flp family type IVb pilin [Hyphomicrobiales bacterium]|nr:Flp family type IVb pilin [Hyphomicrobiales bacterium]
MKYGLKSFVQRVKLAPFLKDDVGATAVEYGLLAALISVVIIVSVTAVGTQIVKTFTTVKNALAGN